jgi:hypothetical protein
MPSFSLTPLDPFPPVAGPFPVGTQFQDELVNVGPPEPKYVNFTGPGVNATYDNSSGRVNVFVPGSGGSVDLGKPILFAKHTIADQTSEDVLIYEDSTQYDTSKGQYDNNTGIFTAIVQGFFSFSASSLIKRTFPVEAFETWYLGIGTYDTITGNSFTYAASQFNDIFIIGHVVLASSVSVSLPLNAGQKVVVAVLSKNDTTFNFNRVFLSNDFFFLSSDGTFEIGANNAIIPSFSVIYHPLNLI